MLSRYFAILRGERKPKYLAADIKSLHADVKNMMRACALCEHRCGVNRIEGEVGVCGVKETRIASMFDHWGEESVLVPSYTIFFSGCNFKCVYCQNWDISQFPNAGRYVPPERLARHIQSLGMRVKNINWVGGDPTPNLCYVLDVLCHCESPLPQVWNSNMYVSSEAMHVLNKAMDLFLTDFKYGNNDCARRLSKVNKYWEVVTRNHSLIEGDIIIRHLVLPGHLECCTKPVLLWISENLPNAHVNVMAQYRPEYRAWRYEELSRRLRSSEYGSAIKYAESLGLILV